MLLAAGTDINYLNQVCVCRRTCVCACVCVCLDVFSHLLFFGVCVCVCM